MFLKVFTVRQIKHCDNKEFRLLTTLLLKANFSYIKSKSLLNSSWSCSLLPLSSNFKNTSLITSYIPFVILKVSMRSLLTLLLSKCINPMSYDLPSMCNEVHILTLSVRQWKVSAVDITVASRDAPIGRFADNRYRPISTLVSANCRLHNW